MAWQRPYEVGGRRRESSEQRIELYPNAFAGSTVAADPGDGLDPDNASNCAQCGFHLEDRTKTKTCPHCGSDNFEGGALTK